MLGNARFGIGGDGSTKIFLNTQGTVEEGTPPELIAFLNFVHKSSEKNASVNDRLWQLFKIMQALKGDKEKEEDYMTREAWVEEGEQRGERRLLVNAFLSMSKHTENKTHTIEIMSTMFGIPKDEIISVLVSSGVLSDKEYVSVNW